MLIVSLNPVDALEEEVARSTKKTPFLFSIKENEKALIHALVNLPDAIVLPYHESWDEQKGAYAASNICAAAAHVDLPNDCQFCVTAENTNDKRLKARSRVFLPVYVHAISQRVGDRWITVTYKGDDGIDHPSGGLRVLELKGNIGKMMNTYFKESTDDRDDRTLQACDYVIERMSRTEYAVSPKPGASRAIPDEFIKEWAQTTQRSLIDKITDMRPIQIVGELNANVAALPRSPEAVDF